MNQLQFPQFLLFDIFARVLGHYFNQCEKGQLDIDKDDYNLGSSI